MTPRIALSARAGNCVGEYHLAQVAVEEVNGVIPTTVNDATLATTGTNTTTAQSNPVLGGDTPNTEQFQRAHRKSPHRSRHAERRQFSSKAAPLFRLTGVREQRSDLRPGDARGTTVACLRLRIGTASIFSLRRTPHVPAMGSGRFQFCSIGSLSAQIPVFCDMHGGHRISGALSRRIPFLFCRRDRQTNRLSGHQENRTSLQHQRRPASLQGTDAQNPRSSRRAATVVCEAVRQIPVHANIAAIQATQRGMRSRRFQCWQRSMLQQRRGFGASVELPIHR